MTEHTYPATCRGTIRAHPCGSPGKSWIPFGRGASLPILRFMLAKQIANAVAAIDPIQRVAAHAIALQAFFMKMDSDAIRQIAEISPGLVEHIVRLSFHATPNDNNKE